MNAAPETPPTESGSAFRRLLLRLDLILLAALLLAVAVGAQVGLFQWDAEAYHAAGKAWMAGSDPYDVFLLTRTAGKPPLPFLYPPTLLPLAGALSLLPLPLFHLAFFLGKAAALYLLFRCWNRLAGPGNAISPAFALLAFHGALFLDLGAGNIALFEGLLVWLALEAWIGMRIGRFAALIFLAGQFKLLPFGFLALGAWEPAGRRRPVFVALFAALLLFAALAAASPDRWRSFLSLASVVDERGAQSPCLAALCRDVTGTPVGSVFSGPGLIPYLVLSLVIVILTWRAGRAAANRDEAGRRDAAFLAVLAFALVAPRFKSYSYLLLIPAADRALRPMPGNSVKYIFMCFGLMPFMPFSETLPAIVGYLPVLWTAWFWWILRGKPADPRAGVLS